MINNRVCFLFFKSEYSCFKMLCVLVSVVSQSESAICVCVCVCVYSLLGISFPLRSSQSIEQNSLCCTISSHYLSVLYIVVYIWCFLGGSVVKNPPAIAGDPDLISGLGRSPGGGNDNPLQYSCLQSPMDSGAWQATDHGFAESRVEHD